MSETLGGSATSPHGVRARLKRALTARVLGRESELGFLERALLEERAPVVFVHGIGGIGKTSLLDVAEVRLTECGCRVLRFEAHEIEPTPQGLLEAISGGLGVAADLSAITAALEAATERAVVLAIDEYDGLRLLDAWIRRDFAPSLPARAHLLLLGRSRPVAAWTSGAGWAELVRALELGPLSAAGVQRVLAREPIASELHRAVERIVAGHPLALRLAAAALAARPDLPLAEIESRYVISELASRFLTDVRDPAARAAVEAASVLRRVTRPLLAEMLGASRADGAIETLLGLPFVEPATDGLVLHPLVRDRLSSALRSLDPSRHQSLRSAAWRALRREIDEASRTRRWQVTADVLYLCEHAQVREAFFPTDVIRFGVEPARANERDDLLRIVAEHAGPSEARALAAWWEHAPQAFHVVRDDAQRIAGVCVQSLDRDLPPSLAALDPVLANWQKHRAEQCSDRSRPALFVRCAISDRNGSAPCEERAACYLDVKRVYFENLDLAAVYFGNHQLTDDAFSQQLGFDWLYATERDIAAGHPVHTAFLRFKSGVIPWLSGLIDALCEPPAPVEPAVASRPFVLDRDARQLIVEGRAIALTRLEFGVLDYLEHHAGEVASRDQLLESVWGQAHTGSNVVDAVVRSIRKKLGAYAPAIRTITGFGYKLE